MNALDAPSRGNVVPVRQAPLAVVDCIHIPSWAGAVRLIRGTFAASAEKNLVGGYSAHI